MQSEANTPKELRKFGFLVGGVFGLIGVWPKLFHGASLRPWAIILAGLLILPALVFPKILSPVQRGWMKVGHVLGWINTRIIMAVIFFLVVTPMAWIMRLLGKDPMLRRFEPKAQTYRIKRNPRPATHLTKQY